MDYEHNLLILLNLKAYEKLILVENLLIVDERYLISVRRWLSNDSRNDIIKPITDTLNFYLNDLSKLALTLFNLNKTLKITYSEFEEIHTLINQFQKNITNPIQILNYDIDKITILDTHIYDKNSSLELEPGLYLIHVVGGGAGGGYGGSPLRGGGGSGYVSKMLIYNPIINKVNINIGKGGFGGSKNPIEVKQTCGSSTIFSINSITFEAKGGTFGLSFCYGGYGGSGGGAGSCYKIDYINNGGAGGSGGSGENSDSYLGGIGDGTTNPFLQFGSGGLGAVYVEGFAVSGGGGGGILIDGYDVKADDGLISEQQCDEYSDVGKGGVGFGAGAGSGGCSLFNKKIYHGNGGFGASGVCIINKIDYN